MSYVVVPYVQADFGSSGKVGRELSIAWDFLDGERFIESEMHGNQALVWFPDANDAAAAARKRDVVAIPDMPVNRKLGELTIQERRPLIQLLRDAGVRPARLRAVLGRGTNEGVDTALLDYLLLATEERVPPRLDENGEQVFDRPAVGRARPLPGVIGGGAFPTITTVTETFTGTNGTSPPNGNWTSTSMPGLGGNLIQIQSNQGAGTSTYAGNLYGTNFSGDDLEARWQMNTIVGSGEYCGPYLRMNNTGVSGYQLGIHNASPQVLRAWRVDSSSYTNLGTNQTITLANGDYVGGDIIGSALKGYHKSSAAAWSAATIISATDATYSGASQRYIGVEMDQTTSRNDNIYMGVVVTGSTFQVTPLAAAASTTTITPTVTRHTAATAAAASTTTITPTRRRLVTPTVTAVSTTTAAVLRARTVNPTVTATSTTTVAEPLRKRTIQPAVTATTTTTVTDTLRRRRVNPTVTGTGTVAFQYTRVRLTTPVFTGTSTVTVATAVAPKNVAPTITGESTVTTAVTRRRYVTAAVTGTSTVTITATGGEAITAGSWRITTVNRRRRR